MESIIASDYDGTFPYLASEDKDKVNFIITGENWENYWKLYDDGVRIPVFWNPGKEDLMTIVMHKANIINKTAVALFYEDQQEQMSMLKLLCPKTQFILITGGHE